jgi:NAD+ diphosphatase
MDHWRRSLNNALTQLPLDRAVERREQAEALAERRLDPSARVLVTSARGALLKRDGERIELAYLAIDQVRDVPLSYLGEVDNAPLFTRFLSSADEAGFALPNGAEIADLRASMALLEPNQLGLAAYARGLGYWQSRQRFCGACGAPTVLRSGGHRASCSACAQEYFPRLDPAMIVLVEHDDACLLGRQSSWPAQRFSTLAGFVEIGESLEEAVAREVFEEAGVRLREIHYHSSQPWPFPSSLMLGYTAVADSAALNVGPELEHARWWTLAEFERDVRAGALKLPPRTSISSRLIGDWYESHSGRSIAELKASR